MPEKEKLRIDKYLWAIRIFKTRTMATEACKAGRVKLDGQNIKAAHEVKVGEVYHISKGIERKVVKVTGLLENRTDAKTAVLFYEDQTPVEQRPGFQSMFHSPLLRRDRGAGRPTKRDRREIDDLQEGFFSKEEEDDE
ncbi:RNA-binding S4 domain-containing protein [Mucilaginibacter sp. RS28]|uniref:RNA-binding S4 domain-containing protein n=1 Tax=Mucilaginibacter straminoryzae TaxID=2932774 RepID=A0A9X2B936_9SPHI|nr:RNA-binding S4 domain-containing protein [Mucilaginibacter straminoryzae]MCJ8210209.1 RNA-binding S4 domain-containing protein [Mucilaginibacter straminoryzae]